MSDNDSDWLARELKKNRKDRRWVHIGSIVGVCLLVGISVIVLHSLKHNTPVKLANSSATTPDTSSTLSVGSSNASPATPTNTTPAPVISQPQLPSNLSSSDQAKFTTTFNDSYTFAGDIGASKTSAFYQDQLNISSDIQSIKDISSTAYSFSTESNIITVETYIINAYNQYTQASSDVSQIAEVEPTIQQTCSADSTDSFCQSSEAEVSKDQSQKQTDMTEASSNIQSAQTALISIE
ncbi:MAG TPA: hypothetical protein VMQ52_01245 [Candidatus Saccharimonadales bacterium]|jgi:hypothetical protein|nr:hypothetical protein [Candidatus Saccharimonadales bacterium]